MLSLLFLLLLLLEFLLLLFMLLLQLLKLLLLSALNFLLLAVIGGALLKFLLFLLMLLLDALPLLVLLLAEAIKLLLVFLFERGIGGSCVRRSKRRRTVWVGAFVIRRRIPRTIRFFPVFGRTIRSDRSAGCQRAATAKLTGPRSGGDIWTSVIHRS